MVAEPATVTVAPEVSPSNAFEIDPSNPLDNGLPPAAPPELIVETLLHVVPLFGPVVFAFLGLQVFVSGSVNPKYSGPSACPSMK